MPSVIPVVWEAKAGGSRVQSQPQQKQDDKQLSETLTLNKVQNGLGMWLSGQVPLSSIPGTIKKKKKRKKEGKERKGKEGKGRERETKDQECSSVVKHSWVQSLIGTQILCKYNTTLFKGLEHFRF